MKASGGDAAAPIELADRERALLERARKLGEAVPDQAEAVRQQWAGIRMYSAAVEYVKGCAGRRGRVTVKRL